MINKDASRRTHRLTTYAACDRHRGFSLIELVVVIIIVGVLAAIAVPKYIAMGRDARVAAVTTLASALRSTAENVRAMCRLAVDCDYTSSGQIITIAGQLAALNYGWLDAGDILNSSEIDAWVMHPGFTATLASYANTLFTLDGSPDPPNCSVNYFDANARGPVLGILITTTTSGC